MQNFSMSSFKLHLSRKLEVGNSPLHIGGIRDINTILNRTGQVSSHDFVGCVRSFIINGQDKLKEVPTVSEGVTDECPRATSKNVCLGWDCRNNGLCVDRWAEPVCSCGAKYSGVMCEKGKISDRLIEPCHDKTRVLPMRKQKRESVQ